MKVAMTALNWVAVSADQWVDKKDMQTGMEWVDMMVNYMVASTAIRLLELPTSL